MELIDIDESSYEVEDRGRVEYDGLILEHEDIPEDCEDIQRLASILQVDIDSPDIPELFFERLEKLKEHTDILGVKKWRSRSGNIHIEVRTSKLMGDLEAIFLQLFLGSDPIREFLSLRRLKGHVDPVSRLFKPLASKIENLQV